jgi:hypothetical protein
LDNIADQKSTYLGQITSVEISAHRSAGRRIISIFSEADEQTHVFQAHGVLTVHELEDIFYVSTNTTKTDLDRFKWFRSGANLAEWRDEPVFRLADEGEDNDWIFVQKPVRYTLGIEQKSSTKFFLTFEEIVTLALGSLPDAQQRAVTVLFFFDDGCEEEAGSLTFGHGIWLRDGMTIKVDNTGRS